MSSFNMTVNSEFISSLVMGIGKDSTEQDKIKVIDSLVQNMTETVESIKQQNEDEKINSRFSENDLRVITEWGSNHLPENVFSMLDSSYDGIKAMHNLMLNQNVNNFNSNTQETLKADTDLESIIASEEYFKDPDLVKTVTSGFKKLYR